MRAKEKAEDCCVKGKRPEGLDGFIVSGLPTWGQGLPAREPRLHI